MSYERARRDTKRILSGEFTVQMTLENPDRSISIGISGWHTRKNLLTDIDQGRMVHSRIAHATFDLSVLYAAGYPVDGLDGDPKLDDHILTAPDASGKIRTYIIAEMMPDDTTGNMTVYLNDLQ